MRRKSILLLFGVIPMLLAACARGGTAGRPPPPEVMVAEVVQRDVPVIMELVGQAAGSQDVEVRARVEGFLETVAFTEGTLVKQGQLLYKIDPKPFEAAVANAKANLATSQARLDKTSNDVKRYTPLVAQQAVSQMELDNAVSAKRRRCRPGGRGQGGPGQGAARPRLHHHQRADRRPGRHDEGEGRQPGRARREHAARHDLGHRPDLLPRRAWPRPST